MISSLSFFDFRSWAGDSVSLCSLPWMSSSCRRRSRLNESAMLSKVSSTFGLSSASIAASDIEFSRSSSSRSLSAIAASSPASPSPAAAPLPLAPAGLNGVAGGGARRRRHRLRRLRHEPGRAGARAWRKRQAIGPDGGRHLLGIGARIGRFEIDDVAQEDFSFVDLVAPDDDGLEGQRAFAEPGDHRLAAGLDALGNGDFALSGEQLHRAHLAQIHAHRVVGALGRLARLGFGQRLGCRLNELATLALFLFGLLAGVGLLLGVGLLGLDDVDAHLAHHRQHVFDLLGGDFLGRHHRIELLVGDVAALLGLLDHLLDRRVRQVEQRQRGIRSLGGVLLGGLGVFRRWGRLLHGDLGPARNGLGDSLGNFLGGLVARALVRHRCLLHLHRSPMRLPLPYSYPPYPGSARMPAPTLCVFSYGAGKPAPTVNKPARFQQTGQAAQADQKVPLPYAERIGVPDFCGSQGHVKHPLTLRTARATTYSLPPSPTGPSKSAYFAPKRLQRSQRSQGSRRTARGDAEAFYKRLGSIERGQPRLYVTQPGIVCLGVVLAERQFLVLQFHNYGMPLGM